MLRTNRLKRALAEGREVHGIMASLPVAASIELIAEAGFDFVVIDTEHVLINPETVEHMIRTAESYRLTPLVRVGEADPKTLLRLLDGGAQGIVLPNVEDPVALERAVAACKYAPEGERSLNAGRPGSFGKAPLADYVVQANREILVVAMIESRLGVAQIEAICAVPGLDMVLEGAADLSQSLGVTWQTGHSDVVQALEQVQRTAKEHRVPYCAFLRHAEAKARWQARGVSAFMLGDERGIAFRALQKALSEARDVPLNGTDMSTEFTSMKPPHALRHAQAQIMQSLVDGLLVEGLLENLGAAWLVATEADDWLTCLPVFQAHGDNPSQRFWHWRPDRHYSIAMLLQPGISQAWEKVPRTPVIGMHHESGEWESLDPVVFMRRVFGAMTEEEAQALGQGQKVFLEALSDTLWQAASSVEHQVETCGLLARDTAEHFVIMEQWASLLDRPYHPTAKAKQGLSESEYRAYMAEFNAPITLRWVAMVRDQVMTGAGVGEDGPVPVEWLAGDEGRQAIEQEMMSRDLAQTHVAIPVHPWQHEHALPQWLQAAFAMGDCVSLDSVTEPWLATSSLRSLAPTTTSPHYLKLPMAIHSLGASRYLPAVKMYNGDLSARLLHQAREKDARLAEGLYLCDERKWWAYMPQGATLFDEAPRHLSAMVRSYPRDLLEDPGVRLVPMATLGTPLPGGEHHVFDDWLAQRGMTASPASVQVLFAELCDLFFEINLRMFRLGMLAEVHGQNAVLVFKGGQCHGLLLRDHDSLRISVARLEQYGMQDPCYCIKPGHANTLYHDSLEALLFWLQTLGIQVNLRSIIDTLAGHYTLSPHALWREMAARLEARIDAIPFDSGDREMLKAQLFEREQWPYKCLIAPIIERAGGPGSMPFGTSSTCNPFVRVGWHIDETVAEAVTET